MSLLWLVVSVSIEVFWSWFGAVLQIGADRYDAEPFIDGDIQRVFGQVPGQARAPVIWVNKNARKDALFGAVLGYHIMVEVACDDVTGGIIDTEGFGVAKPVRLGIHRYLTESVLVAGCPVLLRSVGRLVFRSSFSRTGRWLRSGSPGQSRYRAYIERFFRRARRRGNLLQHWSRQKRAVWCRRR